MKKRLTHVNQLKVGQLINMTHKRDVSWKWKFKIIRLMKSECRALGKVSKPVYYVGNNYRIDSVTFGEYNIYES